MKKIIILLSLLLAISVPEVSYSQDKELRQLFISYTDELAKISGILERIELDLFQISMKKGHDVAGLSALAVMNASSICFYESLLLRIQAELLNTEPPDLSIGTKDRIETYSKADLDGLLDSLGNLFAESRHNATLYLIDKARDNIRSAVVLFNKIVAILEEDINGNDKERNKLLKKKDKKN